MNASATEPHLVVWDFDGTIADTHGVIVHSFEAVYARCDLGVCDAAAARASIGLPLSQAFDRLLGPLAPERSAQLVADPKPDPAMVAAACTQTGIDPNRALVIGDTIFDIEMGRRAGATTCGVTWGNQDATTLAGAAPDHLANTVADLGVLLSR